MSGNTTYMFTIQVNGANATATLNSISQTAAGTTSMFEQLSASIRHMGECAFAFNNINEGLQNLSDKLDSAIEPGVALNTSLADLSAVTGVTGKGLKEIEGYARDAAKTFGGSAADGAESYKLILSQLSPEIAKVPKALALMGEKIAITSKTMCGDTKAAAEVLTTAMNQFQVSLDDPTKAAGIMGEMMNIMAAAAKEGSAELPTIKAALEQTGMAAKMAGVSFAETNAAIQILDKAGKKGSEGGVALRNVMATLGQGRFLPKDVQEELKAAGVNIDSLTDKTLSLSQRLKPLQGIMADDALVTKMFGKENSNAALALLSGLDAVDRYTSAIQGTNTATEQAGVIMDSYAEKMSRQQAWIDDLKISLFNVTGELMPYVKGVVSFFQGTASVMMGVNALACFAESAWAAAIRKRTTAMINGTRAMFSNITGMGVYNALTLASVATTYAFSFAIRAVGKAIHSIQPIGWIVAGISLIITAFKILWDKCEGFRRGMFAVWEVVKAVFYNIGVVIKVLWENVLKPCWMFLWDIVKTVASGIRTAMEWCWNGIVAGFTIVGDFFVSLWDGVMSGVSVVGDFFSGIWNWLAESCGSVATWISGTFAAIAEPVKAVFSGIGDFFSGIFNKIAETVGKFFNWISGIWGKLFPKEEFKSLGEAAETGLAKGSESWRKSQEQKKKEAGAETAVGIEPSGLQEAPAPLVSTTYKTGEKTKKKAGKGNWETETINLNNIKGSTSYGAIAAKMAPVRIAGLAAVQPQVTAPVPAVAVVPQAAKVAPVVAMPVPKATTTMPAKADKFSPDKQEYPSGQTDYLKEIASGVRKIAAGITLLTSLSAISQNALSPVPVQGKEQTPATVPVFPVLRNTDYTLRLPELTTRAEAEPAGKRPAAEKRERPAAGGNRMSFAKFCDNIVINVPAGVTDARLIAEQVKKEIMNGLNNSMDNYEA